MVHPKKIFLHRRFENGKHMGLPDYWVPQFFWGQGDFASKAWSEHVTVVYLTVVIVTYAHIVENLRPPSIS